MPKKKQTAMKQEETTPSFEQAMERIEAIVEAMESDSLSLEDMLGNYEEGSRLLRQCQERIEAAQKRIEIISAARENGAVTLKEFESERTPAAAAKPQSKPTPAPTTPTTEEDDEIRLF